MKFSFDSKMVERKITIWQMVPLLWANILNIFMLYYVKVFCDRWHYFCHEKFALLIKVYMNTTVRQMAPLQNCSELTGGMLPVPPVVTKALSKVKPVDLLTANEIQPKYCRLFYCSSLKISIFHSNIAFFEDCKQNGTL